MKLLPWKKSKEISRVALFDIGSASVAGAVVEFSKTAPPNLLFCTRELIPFQESFDEKGLLLQTAKLLERVAGKVIQGESQGSDAQVSTVACVLASPWCKTQTTTISSKKEEPFEVTKTVMNSLVDQIRKNNQSQEADTSIEELVIHSTANGYQTGNLIGRKVKELSIVLLETKSPTEVYSVFQSSLEKVFGATPTTFHSFTLSAFSVARDLAREQHDFLLVDVTGETTDILVTRNNVLSDTLSFPYGKNALLRTIANNTGKIGEVIQSQISLMLSGEGAEDTPEMKKAEESWANLFGKTCAELASQGKQLPNTIFLVADDAFYPWFSRLIERIDFSQFTIRGSVFETTPLNSKAVTGLCTVSGGSSRDNFLIIDALFYNKLVAVH
jgi:hypothetical protein